MPLFNYTPTKQMAQVTPVNFNAAPNLSFSRAIANLQEAAIAGAQLKDSLNKDQYEKDLITFQQKRAVFNTKWEESDFDTRLNVLIPELDDQFVRPYADNTNKYARDLYLKATSMSEEYYGKAAKEGVEDRFRDNEVNLINQMLDFKQEWSAEGTQYADRNALLNAYDEKFIAPYENNSDPYSQALLKKSLSFKEAMTGLLSDERVGIKDNVTSAEILEILTTATANDGFITPELWADIQKKGSKNISGWEARKGQLLSDFSVATMRGMIIYADEQKNTATWDTYLELKDKVAAFAKIDPKAKANPVFGQLSSTVDSVKQFINAKAKTAVLNDIENDNVSQEAVNKKLLALLDHKGISVEESNNYSFQKSNKMLERNVKKEVYTAFINDDMETLTTITNKGNGAVVSNIISSNLETQLRKQLSSGEVSFDQALDEFFLTRKKYDGLPINIQSSELIDSVLGSTRDGSITSVDQMQLFVTAYKKAVLDNKYNPTNVNDAQALADYAVIKGLVSLNTPNIVDVFTTTRGGTAPKQADVDTIYNEMVANDAYTTLDLSPVVNARFKNYFQPAIKAMLKYGLDPTTLGGELEDVINSRFIRTSSTGSPTAGRILIPVSETVPNEVAYKRLIDGLSLKTVDNPAKVSGKQTFKVREVYAQPKEFDKPNGDWVVFYPDGRPIKVLLNDEVKLLVEAGASAPFVELDN